MSAEPRGDRGADRRATTAVPLHDLLAARWSPRSFDPEAPVADADLDALLEAARWAPSAQNRQPRRFAAGRRGTELHRKLAALVNDRNRVWAPRAALLVLGIAEHTGEDGARQRFAEYDLGQSVAHLTVQALHLGLHVRQMGGFDAGAAATALAIEEPYVPFVLVAVGRATPTADLEPDFVERDTAPRLRLPLDRVVLARS